MITKNKKVNYLYSGTDLAPYPVNSSQNKEPGIENLHEHSQSSIKAVFDNMKQAVILVNESMEIKWHNKKADEIFNLLFNRNLYGDILNNNVLAYNYQEFLISNIKEAFCGNSSSIIRKEPIKDNDLISLEIHFLPISDHNSGQQFVLISLYDITEQVKMIESIEAHDSILKAVSFAAERFLKSNKLDDDINEVLEELGKVLNVQRINIFKDFSTHNEKFSMHRLFEWNDHTKIPGEGLLISTSASYVRLGIERWRVEFALGKIVHGSAEDFPIKERKFLYSRNIKSILLVPIFVGNIFYGFIGFEDCIKKRKWTSSEIDAIKTSGQILGAAIQRKNFEIDLVKAREEAEKSDKLKTEFLAQMSHEIRTPINSILSFTSLLKEETEAASDELSSIFKYIDSGGRRLIRTIDMILNMSQFQTNNYEYQLKEIDLANELLEPAILEFRSIAQEKNLELLLNKKTDPAIIKADPYTIGQIFINLIDNAIKYTQKGLVEVTLYRNLTGNICVDVKDTGIGISKEYLPSLFTPFSQEEMGYTRKYDGNGLGLALVKKYSEINNVDIIVNTEKNVGSTFTVIFK